ncbi:ATP-binding protein [Streptomyces sp. NPDC059568]|uniref:ATP-binding protein n=1 Tax=Streptomyces sp. NPDC059568 TaxID=3346868 RepID=UPI0036A1BDF8
MSRGPEEYGHDNERFDDGRPDGGHRDGARADGTSADGPRTDGRRYGEDSFGGERTGNEPVDSAQYDSPRDVPHDSPQDSPRYDDGRVADGRYEDERVDEGRYEDGRYEDVRADGSSYNGGQYSDGSYSGDGSYNSDSRHDDGSYDNGRHDDSPYDNSRHDNSRHDNSRHDNSPYTDERPADSPESRRPPRVEITPAITAALAPKPAPVPPPATALGHLKGSGSATPSPARTVQLVSGDLLLTVNPVDGSEIELCPPGRRPAAPARRTAEERAALQRAGRPPVPPGPAAPPLPLLERAEERARLAGLLGRGRSVYLTGPAGSGRTALLEAVAADCANLAPDGVVRLSGHHRTGTELLHELYSAVYKAALRRPDRTELLALVQDIGAVVVLDDLELGGEALDELLGATPECAYLLAPVPGADAPSADARLDEVALGGLGRGTSLELLERAVERPLTDEEANWSGDLWFESEGLPLRFVQAGALLRQRDQLRGGPGAFDEFEPFEPSIGETPVSTPDGYDIPLPSLGEGAAPAALLASRLSEAARATLRFAVALGGEVPHQAHLPALVGDTHADAALGELMSCGLLTPVGARYRLATGVVAQLEAKGYGDDAVAHAHTAAQHYAWWTGHPSVTPERAAAEADAILAALGPLVPGQESGHASAAVLLARSAAPAFLAGLHWGAWERALRTGSEAARLAGEVAEEAYFHHELGVLALCVGNLDRARAELEASIGMRGAVADKIGTVAGRRALALVADREGPPPGGRAPAGEGAALVRYEGPPLLTSTPALGSARPALPGPSGVGAGTGASTPLVTRRDTPVPAASGPHYSAPKAPAHGRRPALGGARRNLVAAGAGAVLAAVLGTVVTLGATSGNDTSQPDRVSTEPSTDPEEGDSGLTADQPAADTTRSPGGGRTEQGAPAASPTDSGTPSGTASASDSPTGSGSTPGGGGSSSTPGKTPKPPTKPSTPPTTGTSSTPSTPPTTPTGTPSSETPSESSSAPPPPATASDMSPSLSAGAPEPATSTDTPV